ncbi:protein NO VEIN domain-containing protein [Streptomyces sp. NPDC059979]|uniref:protein NO VEIN domain-containing protein n=1 Tax=Streptomyces sp. NPDC059979 TaxID=3347021 RepID=UPI0036C4534D
MNANEVEHIAMALAVEYEQAQGRQVADVSRNWGNLGSEVRDWLAERHQDIHRQTCDLVSRHPDGSLARLIEVKGRGGPTSVSIIDRQHSAMLGCGEDWWLYVALECRTPRPKLVIVNQPARLPWHRLTGDPAGTQHGSPKAQDEGHWHVG